MSFHSEAADNCALLNDSTGVYYNTSLLKFFVLYCYPLILLAHFYLFTADTILLKAIAFPSFLAVPLELRFIIHKYILAFRDEPLSMFDSATALTRRSLDRSPTAILQTSRQVHNEATYLHYSTHHFSFAYGEDLTEFLDTIGPRNRSYIRNVSKVWLTPRPDPSDVMMSLRMCDSLQHLQLKMFPSIFCNVPEDLHNIREISWVQELLKIRGLKFINVDMVVSELGYAGNKSEMKLFIQLEEMLQVLKEPKDSVEAAEVTATKESTEDEGSLKEQVLGKKVRVSQIPFSFQPDTCKELADTFAIRWR
ncbi:hypothetical protein MMC14_000539 [Varicellaria rhodocarpa]|nr:hypothetical protein [Varicellaria rhodocarpa]